MDNTADVTMTGEETYNDLGYSVSGACDVNNDGYDDVIVGAYGFNSSTGRVYIFYGGGTMDNTADVTMTGEGINNFFGYSVSGAGDVNNDGNDEVIVGAYSYPVNGKAYIYSIPSSPVPIELVSFSANVFEGSVKLSWETATEVNNYGFQVERQNEKGKSGWVKIGFVEGHGNSNSTKEYTFTDKNSPVGKLQYRLKQIDINDNYKYSQIVKVIFGLPNKFELKQNYPNPFNPTTTISYVIPNVETRHTFYVQLIVYDALGREVTTLVNTKQTPGKYSVQFNATGLPSGIYFISIRVEGINSKKNFGQVKKALLLK